MPTIITGVAPPGGAALTPVWRLRHQVFVEELGWEALRRPDRREIDAYDTPEAVHILVHRRGRLAGYTRLLPTTGPHILADVFPHLCPGGVPRGAGTMEWTRQCVAPAFRGGTGPSDVHAELIIAVLDWCVAQGTRHLTAEGSARWIERFQAIGIEARALGPPHSIEGRPVVAMLFGVDPDAPRRARQAYGFGPAAPALMPGAQPAAASSFA